MSTETNNNIIIKNRSHIEIGGVQDVISYDQERIVLALDDSELLMQGSNFYIKKIDVENKTATVTGYICSLSFSDTRSASSKSFLRSLFK